MVLKIGKGLYHATREFIEKKGIEKIINDLDGCVDASSFPGFAFYPRAVEPISLPEPEKYDRFGMHTSRHISREVATVVKEAMKNIKPLVVDYLGPEARLDDLCVWWFSPHRAVQPGVSGGWHQDNCGHRLKLYICLKGDGSTPTVILPGSHRVKYKFGLNDARRFFGISDTSERPGEVRLRYKTGDVAIFDTHALHRGYYESPATDRVVILGEFINRKKSNLISGKAPCGPSSHPEGRVYFDSDAHDILMSTGMLDAELSRRQSTAEGDFCYSIRNRLVN